MKVTLAQTKFNPNTDKKIKLPLTDGVLDSDKIECWVADYARSNIKPEMKEDIKHRNDYCKIMPSSNIFKVKVRGGFKKLSCGFYDSLDEQLLDKYSVDETCWTFEIDGVDVSSLIALTPATPDNYTTVKVKFLGTEEYLNKILTVKVRDVDSTITTSTELEIVSL